MMTNKTILPLTLPPSKTRLLFRGGITGFLSASLSSICLVILEVTVARLFAVRYDGFQSFSPNLIIVVAIMALWVIVLCILTSFVPSFIGGALLAWKLYKDQHAGQLSSKRAIQEGFVIGSLSGLAIVLLFLLPIFVTGGHTHYLVIIGKTSVVSQIVLAIEVIVFATLAGMWTGSQLHKQLSSTTPNVEAA